jgi:urease accessory protein
MKNRLATFLALSVTMLAYVPIANAHSMGAEGAGFISGLAHPFMGLDHLLAMIAVGIWAAQTGGSAVWRLPLSFIMMMAVAALISASGFNLPALEPMIAGSVVLLGLMAVFAIRLPVNLSMLLVGVFAVFHGYAHGLEMPQASSAFLYGSGLVLATALLHLLGVGLGRIAYRKHLLSRLSGLTIAIAGLYLATAVWWPALFLRKVNVSCGTHADYENWWLFPIHAGYATQKISEAEALSTWELFDQTLAEDELIAWTVLVWVAIAAQHKAQPVESSAVQFGALSDLEPILLESAFALIKAGTVAEQAQLIMQKPALSNVWHSMQGNSQALAL